MAHPRKTCIPGADLASGAAVISADNITLRFGARTLFEDVTTEFTPGNCYGVIGANGAGKSTFLKILSGEIDPDTGKVHTAKGSRVSFLRQNQFEFDDFTVINTVIRGHEKLYGIMTERDALYAKPDFSDADGMRTADLEAQFTEIGGWEAVSEAASLLSNLGIPEPLHEMKMRDLDGALKVRVLLAQALFGNPDVLLMDEPTNGLDPDSILWLEEFLYNFQNTVIVVSHDRHFLDRVCTHILDIDYQKIRLYTGNYSFWYQASQLALRQTQDQNKQKEEKIKELKEFIARFSANASKARQATSRKRLLDKISLDEIKPSSRRYPSILFKAERESGRSILSVAGLTKAVEDQKVLENFSLSVQRGEKIAFVGKSSLPATVLFQILEGTLQPDSGTVEWGSTAVPSFFPRDNGPYFETDLNLIEWLRQYSKEQTEGYIRGFLGRMLFSGDEAKKNARVLSGGERVRCMLSKMMVHGGNVLVMDEPTNHLDLEAITALNDALVDFSGTVLFSSRDHQFIQTVANRIVEIAPKGVLDVNMPFDAYLEDSRVREQRQLLYAA